MLFHDDGEPYEVRDIYTLNFGCAPRKRHRSLATEAQLRHMASTCHERTSDIVKEFQFLLELSYSHKPFFVWSDTEAWNFIRNIPGNQCLSKDISLGYCTGPVLSEIAETYDAERDTIFDGPTMLSEFEVYMKSIFFASLMITKKKYAEARSVCLPTIFVLLTLMAVNFCLKCNSVTALENGACKAPHYTPIYLWTGDQCREWLVEIMGPDFKDVRPLCWEQRWEQRDIGFTLAHIYQNAGKENIILDDSVCIRNVDNSAAHIGMELHPSCVRFQTALELECIRAGIVANVEKH